MQNIELGAVLQIRPTIYGCKSAELTAPQAATVVYVHPEGRYCTVEFQNSLGWRFRESLPMY